MVIFPREKFLSDEEIISFKRYNAPCRAKTGTDDVTLQCKLSHFQTSEKQKTANLINVIYKLINYLEFEYGKYFLREAQII